ncbi:MAG: hypothetical protein AAGI23_21435 [Bacteroidota bacterium]
MFTDLPDTLRQYGLKADVRVLLALQRAMQQNLVRTLGDLYIFLRSVVTNEPKELGPFTQAFYFYFMGVDKKANESLEDAVTRSDTFTEWFANALKRGELEDAKLSELVDQFLKEAHLTQLDISKILDATDDFRNDDPNQPDEGEDDDDRRATEIRDYRNLSLEELQERLRQIAEQQRRAHRGGNRWIGQDGNSPFGNNGAAKGGVRIGGEGGQRNARQILENQAFYPVDTKSILQDNNIDAALSALKGIEEASTESYLDVPLTIKHGLEEGGIFLPYEQERSQQKVRVLLLIDNGGYSMSPYIKSVKKLFSKMKTRFAHDLKTYYFHNTIYGGVYANSARTKFIPLDQLLKLDKQYNLFVIGDADMAPYELDSHSLQEWASLQQRFKGTAWLNPMRESYWATSTTAQWIQQVFSMYTLTPEGIEKAVLQMNRERRGKR